MNQSTNCSITPSIIKITYITFHLRSNYPLYHVHPFALLLRLATATQIIMGCAAPVGLVDAFQDVAVGSQVLQEHTWVEH